MPAWITWTLIGFLSGSIPYSLLVGKLLLKQDIRTQADHNPGAFNVLRAGNSAGVFLLAALLDGFKGAIPVGLAYFGAGIDGLPLVAVAMAPALGHAYSPWLKFKGGKAIAVTFGTWAGVTIGEAPTFLGILLGLWFFAVENSGWAVAGMVTSFLIYTLTRFSGTQPELILLWVLNGALLLWRYRDDLKRPITFRDRYREWVDRLLGRPNREAS